MSENIKLAHSRELGKLHIPHLKRIWSSITLTKAGGSVDRSDEFEVDCAIFNAIGVGVHQVSSFLYSQNASFAEFEEWIVALSGKPSQLTVQRLKMAFGLSDSTSQIEEYLTLVDEIDPVLSQEDLAFWEEHGYVILKNAVSKKEAEAAAEVIWRLEEALPEDPMTWYDAKSRHGIMIEEIQNPIFDTNRQSLRIHKAFAQLWGTSDLWVSHDRCGFNPPETQHFRFPGPDLHWDLNFSKPLSFSTQGILYLTDTPPEQGALTVVSGFHKHLEHWLSELDPALDPQKQDLHVLGSKPIGAKAGDMIIWHHFLPHGSRPNRGEHPRLVQYINMIPCRPNAPSQD